MLEALKYQSDEKKKIQDQIITIKEECEKEKSALKRVMDEIAPL